MECCKVEIAIVGIVFNYNICHSENCNFKECESKSFDDYDEFLDYGSKILETHGISEKSNFEGSIVRYLRHYDQEKPQKIIMIQKPYVFIEYKRDIPDYLELLKIANNLEPLKKFNSIN